MHQQAAQQGCGHWFWIQKPLALSVVQQTPPGLGTAGTCRTADGADPVRLRTGVQAQPGNCLSGISSLMENWRMGCHMSNLILLPGQQHTAVLSCPQAFQADAVSIPLLIGESHTATVLSSFKEVRLGYSKDSLLEPWGMEFITVTKYQQYFQKSVFCASLFIQIQENGISCRKKFTFPLGRLNSTSRQEKVYQLSAFGTEREWKCHCTLQQKHMRGGRPQTHHEVSYSM